MLLGLLGAAALAAQNTPPEGKDDPDLRCMVAMSLVLNESGKDNTVKEDEKTGLIAIMMYYIGKIDGRMPGFDYADSVKKLVEAPGYDKQLPADVLRCADEAQERGQMLIDLGQELQSTVPLVRGMPG